MLELLLIAQIATGDHYCFMETPTGAVVNLAALCGVSTAPSQPSTQGFEREVGQLVRVTVPGLENRLGPDGWGVEELGQDYCRRRRAGVSEDDYLNLSARLMRDSVLPDELAAITVAITDVAPRYFCPEFAR
jgi:hypothetical protein